MTKKALVFATSHIDSSPDRYQAWVDYYTDFFHNVEVDLLLVNDGPNDKIINLKQAAQLICSGHLGRERIWLFPGWKRSFYYGLYYAKNNGYQYIAHIESDCGIHARGKYEFVDKLFTRGYFTGWCKRYNFPETALQILNEPWVVNYYLDRYSCQSNWYEEIDFEKFVFDNLHPVTILDGDRYEGYAERVKPSYTFLSGCDLSTFIKLWH